MGKGPEVTKKRCVPALNKNADARWRPQRRGRGLDPEGTGEPGTGSEQRRDRLELGVSHTHRCLIPGIWPHVAKGTVQR